MARTTPRPSSPVPARRDLHDRVAEKLAGADQRYTTRRRALVELLVEVGQPVTIGDIARLRPTMPRSSAYRNLVDLEGAGVVSRLQATDEFARYELAEDLTEHHHHLVCVGCGTVRDMSPPPALERSVARAIEELHERDGFTVQSHRLDLLGLCTACR